MAYTLEQKVDICLRHIAANDMTDMEEIRRLALKALQSETAPLEIEVDIDDMIVDLLTEIGTPPHLRGYECIRIGIRLVIEDRTRLGTLYKGLYTDIATEMGPEMNSRSVERSMRRAIEATFDRGDIDRICDLFGGTVDVNTGKLTGGAFMAFCEREIRRRMKRADV